MGPKYKNDRALITFGLKHDLKVQITAHSWNIIEIFALVHLNLGRHTPEISRESRGEFLTPAHQSFGDRIVVAAREGDHFDLGGTCCV